MIEGAFEDDHPRVSLILSGVERPLEIEFIVDTGFAGDLALPRRIARELDSVPRGRRDRRQADGARIRCPVELTAVKWDDGWRAIEVLILDDGDPLVGTTLLRDTHLHVEMSEGGQVLIEPL